MYLSICGANSLNFSTCKRESKSGKIFCLPGICSARNKIVYSRQSRTSLHTDDITTESKENILLIMWTSARLSEKNIVEQLDKVPIVQWQLHVLLERVPLPWYLIPAFLYQPTCYKNQFQPKTAP